MQHVLFHEEIFSVIRGVSWYAPRPTISGGGIYLNLFSLKERKIFCKDYLFEIESHIWTLANSNMYI